MLVVAETGDDGVTVVASPTPVATRLHYSVLDSSASPALAACPSYTHSANPYGVPSTLSGEPQWPAVCTSAGCAKRAADIPFAEPEAKRLRR
eukprot:m51a1_g1668 hypothetical protein (92) ;mRNA; f:387386-387661